MRKTINQTASLVLASCLFLQGCMSAEEYPKTQQGVTTGVVIGAVLGALSGNTDAERRNNAQAGALLGALIGGGIGYHLDEEDKRREREALRRAVAQNRTVPWSNPSSGINGTISPIVSTSGPGCGTFQYRHQRNGVILGEGTYEACKDAFGNTTYS